MSQAIIMIYINITSLEKDHSMIEMCHLKNVIFFQVNKIYNTIIVSSFLKLGGGGLVFEICTKKGAMKNCSEIVGLVERRGGGFQFVSSVFLQKSMFSLLLEFFCLVNIHACCNQQIYSFMWFTFYQKIIYYEIFSPLTLIFKYNFVKILLLMTIISISISLKTSNIFENKSQVFERSDCAITVRNDLYYNELKI